jgi:hypothetical protein
VLAHERISQWLSQCELSMTKSVQTLRMTAKEMSNYEELREKIAKDIADCHQRLIQTKEELMAAKRRRENARIYQSMAVDINSHCERTESLKKLRDLEVEI